MISVVVVNWNRRELLRECLSSLARQGCAGFETIVVDNGSSDGSAEMAEAEFGARVVRNRENRGFCAANNQGIAAARGELIALLNNDAEADPGWLAALARVFEDRPEVGMAASKILVYEDPRRIDKAGHLIWPDGQNRGRGSGALDSGQFDSLEEALWPDGCAAMYRARMLREIGGFDEDFFAYGDDAELGLRARIAGWKCLYAPDAVVRHHRGATLGLDSARRLELIERNRVLLAAKLFPWRLLCLNVPYYLVRLAAGLQASREGRGDVARFAGAAGKWKVARALAAGDLQALAMLPRILRKRGEVVRRLSAGEICELIRRYRAPLRDLA
jgi:GT2 family glycosyltransferase